MSNLIVLHNSHNTEKVIYFLLLERKRRRPALEDDDEIAQKSRSELDAVDPPRKRLDTCRINGTNAPSYGQISEGSPLTPRRQAFKWVYKLKLNPSNTGLTYLFLSYSFRSYSSTRNHQRRSPTTVTSSVRSSSYHSPTRCNSPMSSAQQQANAISRPSSPAAGTRHSTYGDRDRSGHHSSVSRTPSHSSQKSIEGDVVVVREPRIERRDSLRQERGGGSPRDRGDCGIPPGSPGGNSSGSTSASPSVHHRANSGPTIAISMFHDPDSNSGVCMPRRSLEK